MPKAKCLPLMTSGERLALALGFTAGVWFATAVLSLGSLIG